MLHGRAPRRTLPRWGVLPCAHRAPGTGHRAPTDSEIDRYLLQLWPALPAPDAVVRRGSENASYWHGVAAATDPPPPPANPRRDR